MSRIGILAGLVSVGLLLAPTTAHAAGWLAAQDVASAEIPASEPAVAMAPDGDILLAWTGTGQGGNQALIYRAREAFTGFQDFGLGNGHRPVLATDSSGRIWLAFHEEIEDLMVLARSAPNDADNFTDGDDFDVPGTFAGVPDLAVQPDDGAVVWLEGGQVRLGRWSPAAGAVATTIYDGSSGAAKSARVSLDSLGNLATLFNYPVLGNTCPVKARRISATGSLSAIEDVGSTGSDDAGCGNRTDVDLALGPSGRMMATWWHLDSVPPSVEMSLAAPGSAFGAPAPIATSNFDAVTNPEPLASGAFDVHPRGLLGASDATLHAYLTQPPATIRRVSQRFDPPAGPPTVQMFETGVGTADLARNASDQAVGAWLNGVPPCHVSAARGTVAGGLGPRQTIGACGGGTTSDPQVAIDGSGNAAAVWTADGAVKLAIYDATPPELQNVSVPAGATAGQPVNVSASSRDALSATTIRWDFGDGTAANGAGASHSYAAPGRYTVTSRATDAAANSASTTRTVSVGAARGGPDLRSPVVGSLRMASTFRRGSLQPRLTAARRRTPTGTVIRFRVDEPSVTTLSFRRLLRGRRVGRRCRAATRERRHRPRCTRFRAVRRKLTFNTQPGLRRIRFQGRLTRRSRLAPGRYELTVQAVDTAGNRSRPVRKRFRLLAALRRPARR